MTLQSTERRSPFVPTRDGRMFSPARPGHVPEPGHAIKGRGAASNQSGRFERETRHLESDGWDILDFTQAPKVAAPKTHTTYEKARTIITRNESPDISFEQSINPYRGCEHGCVYCFARPTHAHMGLSPGLDFETRLFAKPDAPALLERELSHKKYICKTIAIGTNTDPYQPIERQEKITRRILEVLARCDHPVGIVTKSALVLRDLDILAPMAAKGLVKVALSITTLDADLARRLEPRASAPERRLHAIEELNRAGIPATVMVAPIIPAINDAEIETILMRAAARGAREAGYVMLRLPLELQDLFKEWLALNFPDRLRHVMTLVASMRKGKAYDSAWGERMKGTGAFAWMIGRRFEIASSKNGFDKARLQLRTDLFRPPVPAGGQLSLL